MRFEAKKRVVYSDRSHFTGLAEAVPDVRTITVTVAISAASNAAATNTPVDPVAVGIEKF